MNQASTYDVVIIGAGPAGAVAAALLHQQGFAVCVLEKQYFPRFVIGESLLPYCMVVLEEADLVEAIQAEPLFQPKDGAAFTWGQRYTQIDFTDKFSSGPGTTYQVRRDRFDQLLIEAVASRGVDVRFGQTVVGFDNSGPQALLHVQPPDGQDNYQIQARFVLDASGYGRVLPRLLDLEIPSSLPMRMAHFTHIDDNISSPAFDRRKILITTHPRHRDVWLWTIPFANSRCSIGVVGSPQRLEGDSRAVLMQMALECPMLADVLQQAVWDNDFPFRNIAGYSANVKALHGRHFALLGNAAEFLDPVFSSGVTIALHSARLASQVLGAQLRGQPVCWDSQFVQPLTAGIDVFRTYVNGWYDGRFQNVIYASQRSPDITRKIAAILAGYVWDTSNPFVARHQQSLNTLAELVGEVRVDMPADSQPEPGLPPTSAPAHQRPDVPMLACPGTCMP